MIVFKLKVTSAYRSRGEQKDIADNPAALGIGARKYKPSEVEFEWPTRTNLINNSFCRKLRLAGGWVSFCFFAKQIAHLLV